MGNDYEALEIIGKGSFGTVRKVREKSTGAVYVRKEIEYTSMNTQERNQLISELRILRELNHPNIVKYYKHDHISESKCIHIYMEYCEGGDLAQVIKNFKKNKEQVPEEFVWQVLIQTLLALHRCHYGVDAKKVNLFTQNTEKEPSINHDTVIIHRDIKPDNIFILHTGEIIKLGDFGLAKMLTSQNDFAKTYVGTPYYMSPEVLLDNPYSPVCDIWSLGCVLFELCALQPPFQAKTHLQLQTKIKRGIVPMDAIPSNYSNQLKTIIQECITVDTDLRPSCYELLESLSIRFLRKEMELKEFSSTLNEFQKQLLTKNEELKKKEAFLSNLERKVQAQREDVETELEKIQKKYNIQKQQFEDSLIEEFELRKRQMDMEAKEVRLGYQREFKMVVEQEVQQKLKEILCKQQHHDSHRKRSDPTSPSTQITTAQARTFLDHNKPRGPREFVEEPQIRRSPLKIRNESTQGSTTSLPTLASFLPSSPASVSEEFKPRPQVVPKKRITDELERLSLEKRHVPEYEEVYLRNNRH